MSYIGIYLHIVFVTRHRTNCIIPEKEHILFKYIWEVLKSKKVELIRMNAALNHIHMLVKMPPDITIADLVRDIKRSSSIMIKTSLGLPGFDGWAREYAAISVSPNALDAVINYIINQKEHHKVVPMLDEYRSMLCSDKSQRLSPDWFDQ